MDNNARYKLWQDVESLAAWLIRQFVRQYGQCDTGYDSEDLLQEAYLIHDQCCNTWQAGRDTKYSTYFGAALWRRLLRIYRIRSDAPKRIDVLDIARRISEINNEDGEPADIDDLCSADDLAYASHTVPLTPQQRVEQREILAAAEELIDNMPDTYKAAITAAMVSDNVDERAALTGRENRDETRALYRARTRGLEMALRKTTTDTKRTIEDYTGVTLHETLYSKDGKSAAVIY